MQSSEQMPNKKEKQEFGSLIRLAMKNLRSAAIPLLLALIVLSSFLALNGNSEDIFRTIGLVDFNYVLLSFGAFVVASVFRALRFMTVGGFAAPFPTILRITSLYQISRVATPAQIGEFSYPLLLQKYAGADFSTGFGQLILVRLADLYALVLICALALFLRSEALDNTTFVGGLASLAFAVLLIWSIPRTAKLLRNFAVRIHRKGIFSIPAKRTSRFCRKVLVSLRSTTSTEKLMIALLTICAMVFAFLRAACLIKSVTPTIDAGQLLLVFGLINLFAVVPLRLTAGVGIKEASLFAILVSLNIDFAAAALCTALFSAAALLFPLVFGSVLFALLVLARRIFKS